MRKKITETYVRFFKSLYEPNSTRLTQAFHTIISLVFIWYSLSSWYELLVRCGKWQHNPLVLSFPLSKILGNMKEIPSLLPATGLNYQHVRENFIWHCKTTGCTIYQHNWLTANCSIILASISFWPLLHYIKEICAYWLQTKPSEIDSP